MQFIKLAVWREAIRGLMAFLCNWIYSIMSFCYDLFNNISEVDILTSKDVQPIYNRITMIITIVMVFYVTFQFVKYVVQPDAMTDKEKGAGNLVYKIIIVIVLIAFVPKIFNLAYGVQKTVIKTNVISKVILGNQASTGDANVGSAFSASVFNMFYYVDEENISETCHDGIECGSLVNLNISNLKNDGKLNSIYLGLNETDKNDEPLITFEFDGLLAVIVGGFICYILFLYCIDVGTRWAQLLYLQLIAPIPIISYISPKKDGMFQKWVKQCTTTYIDLFLRVAIINIMLLLCDTLLKSKIAGEIAPDGSTKMMTTLMYVVLIMGVMLFAHKAPKMLAELFPKGGAASGNFGLKATDRNLDRAFGAAIGGTVGAVVGAGAGLAQGLRRAKKLDSSAKWYQKAGAGLFGATKGVVGGVVGGAGRGLISGGKQAKNVSALYKNVSTGAKNQINASKRFGNREENGYGIMDQIGDRAKNIVGARSRTEMLEEQKAPLDRKIKEHDAEAKHRKTVSDKAFDNAVTKGKGRTDGRINNAVNRYNQLQQREKDLEDTDSALRQEYKVGKVKHDEASRNGYNQKLTERNNAINNIDINQIKNNIADDSLGLDKNQFKKQKVEKEYDQDAHNLAKDNYMKDSSIIGADGKPIQVFDRDAWEKDKDKFTKDKITQEFDQNAYDAALETAKNNRAKEIKQQQVDQIEQRFNSDVQQFLYSSQDEADSAQAAALNEIRAQKKKAKDEVSFAYEDWALQGTTDASGNIIAANDQELYDLTHAREEENRLYNLDASNDNRIDREAQIQAMMEKIAREQLTASITASGGDPDSITADDIRHEIEQGNVSRAQAEDDWLKKVSNAAKNESADKVRNITREQERIKRQTAGSGINEGKK